MVSRFKVPRQGKAPKGRSKYGNKKVYFEGQWFDSRRELKRWNELQLMERALIIHDLKRQVSFEVVPACPPRKAVHYIADFVYIGEKGDMVVEDAKGFPTEVFKLKKKLMWWRHGIEVREV